MRREKSLRIGVHHANAVVWEPVYRTHLGDAKPPDESVVEDAPAARGPSPGRPALVHPRQRRGRGRRDRRRRRRRSRRGGDRGRRGRRYVYSWRRRFFSRRLRNVGAALVLVAAVPAAGAAAAAVAVAVVRRRATHGRGVRGLPLRQRRGLGGEREREREKERQGGASGRGRRRAKSDRIVNQRIGAARGLFPEGFGVRNRARDLAPGLSRPSSAREDETNARGRTVVGLRIELASIARSSPSVSAARGRGDDGWTDGWNNTSQRGFRAGKRQGSCVFYARNSRARARARRARARAATSKSMRRRRESVLERLERDVISRGARDETDGATRRESNARRDARGRTGRLSARLGLRARMETRGRRRLRERERWRRDGGQRRRSRKTREKTSSAAEKSARRRAARAHRRRRDRLAVALYPHSSSLEKTARVPRARALAALGARASASTRARTRAMPMVEEAFADASGYRRGASCARASRVASARDGVRSARR